MEVGEIKMEKVSSNKPLYIIIALLLFIIGLGTGYIVGSNKNEVVKEKEVEPINNKTEEQEEKEEDTIDNNMNSIKADIGKDEKITKNIELNGKTLELTYELEDYDETWGGTPVFKINNNKIENKSLYGTHCFFVEYKIILGNDNKEYLLFTYGTYANYLFIINDEGRVIYSINSLTKNEECVGSINNYSCNERVYVIKDNDVYFYKEDEESSYNSEYRIELTKIKLIINNNIVKEEKSSSKINGYLAQCK
jgi:hypothetical protein